MKLSPHFTLAECTRSMTAKRRCIDNTPAQSVIENLELLCHEVFEPVREEFGPFRPSSVYRSPELNTAIGGSKTSDHMTGCAGDIEIAGVPNIELARWVANNLDFDQLILEFAEDWETDPTDGWVHVSYRPEGNRVQILTIDKNGKRFGLP